MGELREKREKFTQGLAELINFINNQGYTCAIGRGGDFHMKNSLHYVSLAADFAIYKDEKYLDKTEDYKFAGEFWKTLDPDFRWGGEFLYQDGKHFSMQYQGKE